MNDSTNIVKEDYSIYKSDEFDTDLTFRERINMVHNQIFLRGVTDENVLNAMFRIPRHIFVSENVREHSYNDNPLPIGNEQTISQPYIVAYMTEKLNLNKTSRVLEIGTGCGYQTSILAGLSSEVFTIEIISQFIEKTRNIIAELGFENVRFKNGDGFNGWAENAPFDAIILTAAPLKIPQPLIDQLADNGRLIAPVGGFYQELVLVEKKNNRINYSNLSSVRFVKMTGCCEKIN